MPIRSTSCFMRGKSEGKSGFRQVLPGQRCILSTPMQKGERKMLRKIMCALGAVALALTLGTKAEAAQTGGSLRISLNLEDMAVTNGAVTIYRVGVETEEGYRIVEAFGGGIVRQEDAMSPHLAKWLAESVQTEGTRRLLDADGNVEFSRLGEGLYLAVQTEMTDGYYNFQPFLMPIPCQGQWQVQVDPLMRPIVVEESPKTGEGPELWLGILGMLGSGSGLAVCLTKRKRG